MKIFKKKLIKKYSEELEINRHVLDVIEDGLRWHQMNAAEMDAKFRSIMSLLDERIKLEDSLEMLQR